MKPLPMLDVAAVRAQFPIFETTAHGLPLIYLDSAASTQQPTTVIAAVNDYHRQSHANIHRGVYQLSQTATRLYEEARLTVARFLNAADPAECVFTRGATESINLVAACWGATHLQPGDEIILSTLEHHSNIVPWQLVAEKTGAQIRVIPINDAGEIQLDAYRQLLSPRTRLVAVNQVSNALGTINPVREIIAAAHAAGAVVLIDGAQWIAHGVTDVQELDADFYVFSGHKLYGPTGIGVLYGKRHLLDAMPPYQGGGDMIEQVTFAQTTYAPLPSKYEAGTPNISGAVGLAAAIDWIQAIGLAQISAHEQRLLQHATARLSAISGLEIKGTAQHKSGVVSWIVVDPPLATLDIGTQLDLRGICIRTGHHCCQPLMDRFGIAATARASFGVYNNLDDIDRLAAALTDIIAAARAKQSHPSAKSSQSPPLQKGGWGDFKLTAAASPTAAANEIAEVFEFLPDWSMRHQHVIDLGDKLPPMPEELKTAATAVHGCQSTVHIAARIAPGTTDIIEFIADSDANLVRGLIALLQQIYSGQPAAAILAFDAEAFFARIGLDQHLSMSRRNGLAAMVQRVRALAQQVVGE
ncbi:SufS family cysteine desulfurase [Chromatium okenii]|uniref:SufS family cysteine desulfurase n=1 Tax=Chromatium okenii TaxID=61644 RepID=UPI0026EEBD25|nr:SufS family cysteine desulfurase [Chromatium okenii]MBV5311181.1 SufS family cysteine desulfurase [Chromatium okenii]